MSSNGSPVIPRGDGESTATVRFWAAARAAAGVESDTVPAGALPDILDSVTTKYPAVVALLPRCSLLVDGVAVGRGDVESAVVPPGGLVEVLPPFAGG